MTDELVIPAADFSDDELRRLLVIADKFASSPTSGHMAGQFNAELGEAIRTLQVARLNHRTAELAALSRHGFPDWDMCVDTLPDPA
jgi:hypothetical protein